MVVVGVLVAIAGCGQETRYRALSALFDGVPKPGEDGRPKPVVRMLRHPPPPKTQRPPVIVDAALPPPREDATLLGDWQDLFPRLPKDWSGDVDWVAAINSGAVSPRRAVEESAEEPEEAAPNLELVPEKEPQFAVTFPHDIHGKWLKCENCHPDPFPKSRGASKITMAKIFEGEFCGRCHGKVAFDMSTGCLRCHKKLLEPGPPPVADKAGESEQAAPGKRLYEERCATCHGMQGKGDGPKAPFLDPKPRDFTRGIFKLRSTPSGSLPTDDDLLKTITKGMPGSSMPAWEKLPEASRRALVAYLKTFSPRFQAEKPKPPVEIPAPPERTPQALAEGKELYKDAGCIECHGERGRGDGTSAPDLKDEWGHKIRPADFTRPERFRGGPTAEDVYRALMTGLSGTPMPGYADTLEPEQAWKLVFYIQTFGEAKELPRLVYGDVAWERQAPANGEQVPAAVFPHWFHRARFSCAVCHPAITQMKKGGSGITMDGLREGRFCAVCHNAKRAFSVSFETCARCHRE
jgi:cytochrome c oxidase cbb3-type subunit 2